jgi:hypothetical protein
MVQGKGLAHLSREGRQAGLPGRAAGPHALWPVSQCGTRSPASGWERCQGGAPQRPPAFFPSRLLCPLLDVAPQGMTSLASWRHGPRGGKGTSGGPA